MDHEGGEEMENALLGATLMQSAFTMMPLRGFRVVFDLLDDRMRLRRRRLNHDLF